jgi:biopolymer transport protein ExbD
MQIGTPVPHRHSRIEIIPLIDIMFFLLASFMMVSLQMSKTENIRVTLPKATQAQQDFQPDMINIAVDKAGKIYFEKQEIGPAELLTVISNKFRVDTNAPVFISGDLDTQHGHMVGVYDIVRLAGVQRVSFAVTPDDSPRAAAP